MIDKLYDTIGGNRTIWAATEAFYRRVLADPELQPFFQSVDMKHLVARQSMFISMLLGGRVVYTGKDIVAAHVNARMLGLTDAHFNTFVNHFRDALAEVGVAPGTAEEIVNLLESKRSAILNNASMFSADA
ncbi:MAG: group 1 truncated hemoglobin [Terriglobia bacterium]|jgi:hemoglobin|nr:group 1 truncated hemoglobin [Terriglobia bacterium]